MSFSKTITFDTLTGFSIPAGEIEFTTTGAQLALESATITFSETCDTTTGFTFSTSSWAITAGALLTLDQTPTNGVLAAKFESVTSYNANWNKLGGVTGTAYGNPTITSNALVCAATSGLYWAINNTGTASVRGKITIPFTSTSLTANVSVFGVQEANTSSSRVVFTISPAGDRVRVTINDSTNTAVALATAISANTTSLTAGNTYEMVGSWDSANGLVRFHIDGALYGTLTLSAWTHGTGAARLYVGAMPTIYQNTSITADDIIMYNAVFTTGAYTAGYSLPSTIYPSTSAELPTFDHSGVGSILTMTSASITSASGSPRFTIKLESNNHKYHDGVSWTDSDGTYSQANSISTLSSKLTELNASGFTQTTIRMHVQGDNTQTSLSDFGLIYNGHIGYYTSTPAIVEIDGITVEGLTSFDASITASGSDEVRFWFCAGGTDYYFDSATSAWTTSDGTYSQTSSLTQMSSNIADFIFTSKAVTRMRAMLVSADGQSTPTIQSITFGYDFGASSTTAPAECEVYLDVLDLLGGYTSTMNAILTVDLVTPFVNNNRLIIFDQKSESISAGYVDISVVESQSPGSIAAYRFELHYTGATDGKPHRIRWQDLIVPNTVTADLTTIGTIDTKFIG